MVALFHVLRGYRTRADLDSADSRLLGSSWEGFCIEAMSQSGLWAKRRNRDSKLYENLSRGFWSQNPDPFESIARFGVILPPRPLRL
jgi:hypothetical protein